MIDLTEAGRVTILTLERREKRNALDVETCERLREAVQAAASTGARALVLTGGGTSFCSGADFDVVYTERFRTVLYETLDAVARAPIPVVAAVNGPAIGAGTQLALAADLRFATADAIFGVPTAKIGIAVDPWTVRRLARLAGEGTARAMLLGCTQLDAGEALRCGLVQRVGSVADAVRWAGEIAELAPLTLRFYKEVLGPPEADGAPDLAARFAQIWRSRDADEGRLARSEHRTPRFEGR